MPDVALLKELLDRITGGNDQVKQDVERCKDLLDRISRRTVRVRIEIDYDGREFTWKVPIHNATAEEWSAHDRLRSGHR